MVLIWYRSTDKFLIRYALYKYVFISVCDLRTSFILVFHIDEYDKNVLISFIDSYFYIYQQGEKKVRTFLRRVSTSDCDRVGNANHSDQRLSFSSIFYLLGPTMIFPLGLFILPTFRYCIYLQNVITVISHYYNYYFKIINK